MKKTLVLAMTMAMGISATAFAANPFSDVPQGHWAYASINKLEAAGVVEGYPDGTFKGDHLMTRYEMAQIVAKAYAKGAINSDDKLMAEFADELDNLGVRVAKLEKKSDNVKITGEVRALYEDVDGADKQYVPELRTRLWVNGEINEGWSYTGMLENTQTLNTNSQESKTEFKRAFVSGRLGGVDVIGGRYDLVLGDGNVFDDDMDGIGASFGDKVKLELNYGKPNSGDDTETNVEMFTGRVSGDVGKLGLNGAYYTFNDKNEDTDYNIWTAGAKYNLGDVSVGGEYLKGSEKNAAGKDDGYVISLDYKGAEAAEKGSYGFWGRYFNQSNTTYYAHTTDGVHDSFDTSDAGGFKGYGVGVNYAIAKNIVTTVQYFDLDAKIGDGNNKTIWTDVTFSF
ncbi:MAG: S-layer homology domain-containing protein [Acidaminococcaceae bacterium]